jgi:hypothetical protein
MSLDREHIASVLTDAAAYGDREAARKWRVSVRSVQRYRAQLSTDAELAGFVADRLKTFEAELGALRVRFLRKALAEMERRIAKDDTKLEEIAEAVRIVGELHQVAEAMGDGGSDGDDPEAREAPGGSVGATATAH